MLSIDKTWASAFIPIESGKLNAFYRQLIREEEQNYIWQEKYSADVVAQGGILVTRCLDGDFYESGVAPNASKT